jgi:uncharacterized protein YutE (UPF0331/DUF86 family)
VTDATDSLVERLRPALIETDLREERFVVHTLVRAGWVPTSQGTALRNLAGFRNVVVHGYERVDLRIVRDMLENRLGELLAFVDALRDALGREADAR